MRISFLAHTSARRIAELAHMLNPRIPIVVQARNDAEGDLLAK